jgi:hypothetical protein
MPRVGESIGGAGELTNLVKDLNELANRLMTYGVPDLRVQRWLKEPRQRLIIVAGTLLALFLIAKIAVGIQRAFSVEMHEWDRVFSFAVLYFVEALVLVIFVLYVVLKGQRDENVSNGTLTKPIKAENRFFQYWMLLLVFWLLLYILLAITSDTPQQPVYEVLRNLLNNLTCIPLLGMFYELTEKTTDKLAAKSLSAVVRWLMSFRSEQVRLTPPWVAIFLFTIAALFASELLLSVRLKTCGVIGIICVSKEVV